MGETVLSLIVRARDLTGNALKTVQARVKNLASRAKTHFTTFRTSVLSVRSAMTALAGAGAFAFVTKKVFDLGAEVEETASKFNTVFGDSVSRVTAFMDEFARKAGLTDNEFKDLAGTTGAVAQGMGLSQEASAGFSEQLLTTAADLTSFNNVPIEETQNAVVSALTGEREQLKRLGIVIREAEVNQRALAQSGKESADALTQAEKATATLALIQEKAGVAMGDLNRTADSNANRARRIAAEWRNFRDVLAKSAMPILGDLLGVVDDNTSRLETWSGWIESNQEVISAWANVVVQSVKFAVQTVVSVLRILFNAGQAIGSVIRITITTFMGHVSNLVNLAIDGINLLLEGVDNVPGVDMDFRINRLPADEFFEESGESLQQLKGDIGDGVDAVTDLAGSWMDVFRASREAGFAQDRAAQSAKDAPSTPGGAGGEAGESGGRGGSVEPVVSDEPGFVGPHFTTEKAEGPGRLKEGTVELREEIEATEEAVTSFGGAAGDAFGGALAGAILASEGMKKGFLGSIAQMAAAKGKFYIAESIGALAQGILGDPKGFAAAKQYAVAAGTMFALAGTLGGAAAAVSGGAGGGGGPAGAAGAGARRQTESAGQAAQPPGTIVVEGDFLDLSDPRTARRFGNAVSELTGRDIVITGGRG